MKKYTPCIIGLFFALTGIAQNDTLPNSGFEVWVQDTLQDYENPEYWDSPNEETAAFGVVTVEKDSLDPFQGKYAARMTTRIVQFGIKSPGVLTLGNIDIDLISASAEITGGVPYKQRPAYFKGTYKYLPENGDSCSIIAVFFRFVPTKGKRQNIGLASFSTSDTVSDWTDFSVEVNWTNDTLPDSVNVILLSSSVTDDPQTGSQLFADALMFEGFAGTDLDIVPRIYARVYPNPTNDMLWIELEESLNSARLIVFNTSGSEVMNRGFSGQKISISTRNLSQGTYYFHILRHNLRMSSGSFIVR